MISWQLSLRLDSEGQPMKHLLTTVVRQVMLELRLRGAHTSAFDRDVQPPFSSSAGSLVLDRNVVDAVRARLTGAQRERAIETLLDAADEHGNPVLVGLRRSASTDWTSVTVTRVSRSSSPCGERLRKSAPLLPFCC